MKELIVHKNFIAMFVVALLIISFIFIGVYATENYTHLAKLISNKLGVRQDKQFDTFCRKEGNRQRSTDETERFKR